MDQAIDFLGKPYHPGAFSAKPHPMWEFVTGQETVQNWTTLLTLIERSDAHSPQDLDRNDRAWCGPAQPFPDALRNSTLRLPIIVKKASAYLTQHSGEIGMAMEALAIPDLESLPRKEF